MRSLLLLAGVALFVLLLTGHERLRSREAVAPTADDHAAAVPEPDRAEVEHWLDVARFNDGKAAPAGRWEYSNWVKRAVESEVPFDQFVREQLARDLLPKSSGKAKK